MPYQLFHSLKHLCSVIGARSDKSLTPIPEPNEDPENSCEDVEVDAGPPLKQQQQQESHTNMTNPSTAHVSLSTFLFYTSLPPSCASLSFDLHQFINCILFSLKWTSFGFNPFAHTLPKEHACVWGTTRGKAWDGVFAPCDITSWLVTLTSATLALLKISSQSC